MSQRQRFNDFMGRSYTECAHLSTVQPVRGLPGDAWRGLRAPATIIAGDVL